VGVALTPMELAPLREAPLVSVLVSNYNYGRFLDRALASVVAQTWRELEVIVCDDGSTDDSQAVLERWTKRDGRIRYVSQPNAGQGAALNAAFRECSGDVIALLDADDWWLETKIERSLAAFRRSSDVGYLAHSLTYYVETPRGRKILRRPAPRVSFGEWLVPAILSGRYDYVGTCSAMLARREIADRVFDLPPWPRAADRAFADRCAMVARVAAFDEALAVRHMHDSSISARTRVATDLDSSDELCMISRRIAVDRAAFARRIHGIELDPELLERAIAGELPLRRHVFLGDRASWAEVVSRSRSRRRAIAWGGLFLLPRGARVRLLRAWTLFRFRLLVLVRLRRV
jgi:glycosyltransferase involved in cell wall biosynthesis